jgi:hypothetical protein
MVFFMNTDFANLQHSSTHHNNPRKKRVDRIGTRLVATHVGKEKAEEFQLFARIEGTTGAQLMKNFVEKYVEERTAQKLYREVLKKARENN